MTFITTVRFFWDIFYCQLEHTPSGMVQADIKAMVGKPCKLKNKQAHKKHPKKPKQ